MTNNFFAVLDNDEVRRITLTQDITGNIRNVFLVGGARMISGELGEIEFNGNYAITDDEILFVEMELPDSVKEAATNSIGIPVLDLKKERVKTLFWYENKVYYFQNFDSRKLLSNRNVIMFNNQTYTTLKDDAFIVDNIVNAIHKEGKFFFFSFANANKIFNLSEFYREATNEEIEVFSKHKNVSISDKQWFVDNSNTVIRKHITLIQKSKVLDNADTGKIQKKVKGFKLQIELDKKGKIVFPSDKKFCKEVLIFLNEQYYIGLITGNKYRTNSKRNVS